MVVRLKTPPRRRGDGRVGRRGVGVGGMGEVGPARTPTYGRQSCGLPYGADHHALVAQLRLYERRTRWKVDARGLPTLAKARRGCPPPRGGTRHVETVVHRREDGTVLGNGKAVTSGNRNRERTGSLSGGIQGVGDLDLSWPVARTRQWGGYGVGVGRGRRALKYAARSRAGGGRGGGAGHVEAEEGKHERKERESTSVRPLWDPAGPPGCVPEPARIYRERGWGADEGRGSNVRRRRG